MANIEMEKQRIKEITELLEQGIQELADIQNGMAEWGNKGDMEELRDSLNSIRNASAELITQIEERIPVAEETQNLSAMKRAEQYITQMEAEKTVFTDEERNLIVNYAYKMDSFEDARDLADRLSFLLENSPNLVAQTVINAREEIEQLPDPMIGLSEMHEYGYTWDEMLPLTRERASELFQKDVEVYQLHVDGAEILIEDVEDIESHGGIFGVDRSQWGLYQAREAHAQNYFEERNMEPVDQLLLGEQDQYGIFQLKHEDKNREIRFMSHDFLQQNGIEIDRENYDLVYTAPLTADVTLEGLYEKFNIDRPDDFRGHSLSMSDVIVLHQNGENTSHYVDTFGFTEVPEFHRYPSIEEQIAEEETVDMLLSLQKENQHNISYYVIEDLASWANNDKDRSALERFDNIEDAMLQFQTYRETELDYSDDSARTTLGFSIDGIEFDVIHVRNDKNYLVQDFTQMSVTKDNDQFLDALQILNNEVGFDKTRLHREMTPEEVKNFVKERFTHQLQSGGLEDIFLYMERFDTLYAQGKMDNLMPTERQRQIQEDIPFAEWENPYIGIHYKYADLADKELSVTEYIELAGMPQAAISVDGLMELVNSEHTAFHFALEDKEHCMQENIPVVTVCDAEEAALFEIPVGVIERARNTDFRGYEPEELAVSIADRYISIQKVEDGYDYTIYDADYKEWDGGVYDNPDISIRQALDEIIADLNVTSEIVPIEYEALTEKAEAVAQKEIEERAAEETARKAVVSDFKEKTKKMFHPIHNQTPGEIEQTVYAYVQSKIDEYEAQAKIVDVVVTGSRCRGLEQAGSDLDVIVEFAGSEREDDLFNLVHEDDFKIGGVKLDINPITEEKTGTLAEYLPQVEAYLTEKAEKQTEMKEESITKTEIKQVTVTLTVAECSEFHNLGEFHEGIESVDEALAIYNRIPPERMRGIRGIGVNLHTEGTGIYEDVQLDIFSGHTIDLEILDYVSDIRDNTQAMELIKELSEKVKDVEILGTFPEYMKTVEQRKSEPMNQAKQLAMEIDQFSYDFDTYEYKDNVSDREAQIQVLTEDISNGHSEYLQVFLREVIEDAGLPENVRRAQELSQMLAEYKPLAKVEELEEQSYNMIDNVLNNGAGKRDWKKSSERVSIKELLSKKKAEITHGHSTTKMVSEKEDEKKIERGI